MKRKGIAVVLSLAIIAMMGTNVKAEHVNPSTLLPCNNTYYRMEDGSCVNSWNGLHDYGLGQCTVYYYVYTHKKYCSSCGQDLGNASAFRCTDTHEQCGNNVRRCTGLYQ